MKSTILVLEDTKAVLFNTINTAIQEGVPCYFLEPVVAELLAQIKAGAKMELEKAKSMEEGDQNETIES